MRPWPRLLDHGADVHHEDPRGITPLVGCFFAAESSPATFRVLLERGADPHRPTVPGGESVAQGATGNFARVLEDLGHLPKGSTDALEADLARKRGWDLNLISPLPVSLAGSRMGELLEDGGADFQRLDFAVAWDAFRRFGHEPVGSHYEHDVFHFEWGQFGLASQGGFEVSFSRQFEVGYQSDEVSHAYMGLECCFSFELTELARAIGMKGEFCEPETRDELDAFFERVESRPAFELASRSRPMSAMVNFDEI